MVMGKYNPVILLLFLIITFSGCDKDKKITGKEFIPREVLVDILVDLHLVDVVTNDRKFHRRYHTDSIDMLNPVFEKYNFNRAIFDTTMAEYSRYPEQLDQVYNEVLIKLNVMLDENEKKETSTPAP